MKEKKEQKEKPIKVSEKDQSEKSVKVSKKGQKDKVVEISKKDQKEKAIKVSKKDQKDKAIKVSEKDQEKKATKVSEKEQEKKNTNKKHDKKQETAEIKERQKRDWKEYIYNCPFLLAITLTSLVVMFRSDEIGIRAVVRQAQSFASESYAKAPEKQEVLSDELLQNSINTDDMENIEVDNGMTDENNEQSEQSVADMDQTGENASEKLENAGECKEDNDDLQDDNEPYKEDGSSENAVNTEEKPKGVTRFEYYEPIPTESRYYKDAGKVAMTTEYPYTKENISYFNDAAFLGDSRTLGISDYAGLEEADFYCDSGMMIFKLLEEGITYQKTGNKVYMKDVLQEKQYGKIYIMLGMNELGYGNTELYLDKYRQVLQQIREWQPEAIIYVMANLHVSREKNNMETEFNNLNINAKNAASASLANGTDVFYLDVNPVFTDEEGYLKAELTFDGVHLYAQHYDAWREFLLEHAVEPDKINKLKSFEGMGVEEEADSR